MINIEAIDLKFNDNKLSLLNLTIPSDNFKWFFISMSKMNISQMLSLKNVKKEFKSIRRVNQVNYYQSLNVVDMDYLNCNMTFHFLARNIHFNLIYDYQLIYCFEILKRFGIDELKQINGLS